MIDNFEEISKEVYEDLRNKKIGIDEYEVFWNRYGENHPEIYQQFKYRKDGRTLGEFAVQLVKDKEKEEDIIKKWTEKCNEDEKLCRKIYNHHPIFYRSYGIEETARLILLSKSKKDFKKPDFEILPVNRLLEVKSNPVSHKATYKVADLEYYVLHNADLLTSLPNNHFLYFTCDEYKEILKYAYENNRIGKYYEVGGKSAIQLILNNNGRKNKLAINIKLFRHTLI